MSLRILPPVIVNRIAAGEVIERPASALKELVENAIDAGASEINITIEHGGRNLISVADNGTGMDKDELELCLERHATSKLSDDDLLNIKFLGFRGEALPSIGSVSRMEITSRKKGNEEAWAVKIAGGEKLGLHPAALKKGTIVEIRDLFFSTPARLKFLKTERTEKQHIVDIINRIAMSHPHIAFSLNADGKPVLNYDNQQEDLIEGQIKRLSAVMGKEFGENSVALAAERGSIKISGYAGLPTLNRGTASAQYLFVNKRPVKDRLVIGAIKAAYQDFLARDRYPMVAVFLDISPEEVDVNVHPAKAEVRFRDSGMVRGLLVSTIKNALSSGGYRASSTVSQAALSAFTPRSSVVPERSANPPRDFGHFAYRRNFAESAPAFQAPLRDHASHGADSTVMERVDAPSVQVFEEVENEHDLISHPLGAARCQLHETYIVAQTNDGIVIVDQHAAHERLVYEKMKKSLEKQTVKTQKLLIPEIISVGTGDAAKLMEQKESLQKLGLVIDIYGSDAVVVRETPAILGKVNVEKLIKNIADDLDEFEEVLSLNEALEHVCSTIACHGSIRSGRRLNVHEMNNILREMEETPFSGQCNHGRPTYVELKLAEIEKLFGRR